MKINIYELGLEEITFLDLLPLFDEKKEKEIEEIKKEILDNGYYSSEFIDFSLSEDDSDTIEGSLLTGSWEIIDLINEMKICQEDPFIMIVKDSWFGENSDGDSVGYTSFETIGGGEEPPIIKGGEYDKKSFMNEDELDEFGELRDNEDIQYDVKYQEFFFIRSSKYRVKEWTEQWLSQDYGHNK